MKQSKLKLDVPNKWQNQIKLTKKNMSQKQETQTKVNIHYSSKESQMKLNSIKKETENLGIPYMDKIKMSKKDFDELYEIEEITEETQDVPSAKLEDTTPEFLTEEEEW